MCSPDFRPTVRSKTPGPGNYHDANKVSLGRQTSSKIASPATMKFGSQQRLKIEKLTSHQAPGPGMYQIGQSIGIQDDSRFVTSTGCRFGTSERQSLEAGLVG